VVICGKDREILFLTPTYSGSVHDKAVADDQGFEFKKMVTLLQDTGFQGFKPEKADIVQPDKKPKGKDLTEEQKQKNKEKSKVRVLVEHSIRGFKIWRAAKDVCRTWRVDLRDYYVLITCGLHNYRLRQRRKVKT
jgi:hypothetical protein